MKKALLIIFAFILIAGGHWLYKNATKPKDLPPEVHIHAGFIVVKDGKKEDFSLTKYMGINPCSDEHKESISPEEEQFEKAHLHDNVGDVVHVHRRNALWKDLFSNLHYSIDPSTNVEGYINGALVENILEQPIVAYDSVVLFLGPVTPTQKEEILKEAVTKEHVVEVENQGESC